MLKKLKKITIGILIFIGLLAIATFLFIQQDSFGQPPEGTRLERIQKSPNYKDGLFQNSEQTVVMAEDASYWSLIQKQFSNGENREPKQPIPSIKKDLNYQIADKVKITWFGHSTVLVQMEGKNILIDPVFSERTSPVQYFGSKHYEGTGIYAIKDLPAIDIVLISHDHYDHLDYGSILQLKDSVFHFYVPLGVGSHLEKWGVPESKITEMDWWDEQTMSPEIKLVATPARHFSGRSLTDRFKTLWASYVIQGKEHTIYFGGDSGYGVHFKEIGEKYGPFDITMLESGQYHTYWPNIHMMPEETVQAHLDLKGKTLLPIHWGKFTLSLHDWNEPIIRLSKQADKLEAQFTSPIIGETIISDSIIPQKRWWEVMK